MLSLEMVLLTTQIVSYERKFKSAWSTGSITTNVTFKAVCTGNSDTLSVCMVLACSQNLNAGSLLTLNSINIELLTSLY